MKALSCLLVASWLAWPGAAAAAAPRSPTLARLEAVGVLRVGTPGDYRPYTDHEPASEAWRGSDVELTRALAAHLGVGVEFVPTTWATLMSDFAAGRFDLAAGGISITAERRRMAAFSAPYVSDGKTALGRCNDLDRFDELRELNRPEVRVIVNPGGTNERFARSRLPRARLLVHGENRTVFDEVASGRADVMITDAVEARMQSAARPGVLCAAHPDRPFDRASKALLLPRDAAFKARVDDWLRARQKAGEIAAVQRRWIDAQAVSPLLALVDARLSVMSDVARFKWNSGGAIEDPVREGALLESLVAQGEALGVPARRTTEFFTAQFAAARQLQLDLFALWRSQHREKLPPAPSLVNDIRPRLDRISAAMVAALAAGRTPAAALAPLSTTLISPRASELALVPLGRRD